jgi:hypothetical protein
VSEPVLTSAIDFQSPAAKACAADNRKLVESLRAKVAEAALGGSEKARERHIERGKLRKDRAAARSGLAVSRDRPARRQRTLSAANGSNFLPGSFKTF